MFLFFCFQEFNSIPSEKRFLLLIALIADGVAGLLSFRLLKLNGKG
jgi:hypothetical protein